MSLGEWHAFRLAAPPLSRKEILTQATAWMTLEDMMLREISQTQKDKSFCGQIHSPEVARGIAHRDRTRKCLTGTEGQFGKRNRFRGLMG